MKSLRQRGVDAQKARTNEKSSRNHTSMYDSEMEILDAANNLAVDDTDLGVLRNTTKTIVKCPPKAFSVTSDSSDHLTVPFTAFPASYNEPLNQSYLTVPSSDSEQSQLGSSPSNISDASLSSWSSIADEFGLNEQELGIWRGADLDWDAFVC